MSGVYYISNLDEQNSRNFPV